MQRGSDDIEIGSDGGGLPMNVTLPVTAPAVAASTGLATGADGSFQPKGLPPGTYTIEAWHEKFGTKTASVTIGAKESKDVAFTFSG